MATVGSGPLWLRPTVVALVRFAWLAAAFLSLPVLAADLTVSAAASLGNAFTEIGRGFETANPKTKVRFNFAASGALLQQIGAGAPVDVFASADQETMDEAGRRRLVDAGSRRNVASNSLVVIVPRDAVSIPASLADLATASIERVAIGAPASVPAGRYSRTALVKAGLWPVIEAKMVGAQSVRQVLDYVARGEVDAGFVYATDAAVMAGKVKVAFKVATALPVRYPIARIAETNNAAAAEEFIAYAGSPAAQAMFAKYGFGKP